MKIEIRTTSEIFTQDYPDNTQSKKWVSVESILELDEREFNLQLLKRKLKEAFEKVRPSNVRA